MDLGTAAILRENSELKARVKALEERLSRLERERPPAYTPDALPELAPLVKNRQLSNAEIFRYGRQLIISEFGIEAQRKLASTSVLLIGAGGLGSPCALYLAGMGVGRLGIVDYDVVEKHNLHRQIAHVEASEGVSKAASARDAIMRFNSDIECIAYNALLSSQNAMQIISPYDIVVDCSDNAVTRYLINDACVLSKKPLVSGAALRMEGQLTVYNNGPECPCYRCLFPKPPPREAQGNCSDVGVLGVVPGIIGCLQALQVVKIACQIGSTLSGKLLLFDALAATFRTVKIRSRQKSCAVCGEAPTVTRLVDYEEFCQSKPDDKPDLSLSDPSSLLNPIHHISPAKFSAEVGGKSECLLLDVRSPVQYAICSLDHSVSILLPV